MPIINPIKRKEYARLSMAIKKAQERGEDSSQLLEQRKSLTQQGIKVVGINQGINEQQFIPRKKYKPNPNKISFGVLLNEMREIWELINQEKNERLLFQSEIREWVKELISHSKAPIVRTTKEKKTEEGPKKKRRNALLTPPGLQYKSSEWWKWYNSQPHRQEYIRKKKQERRLKSKPKNSLFHG